MGYKLRLDIYEGPLDLLLYLIKKNDIEITDIPIVEITEQYMEYIELMKMLDLDIVGDFLVMAATLMHIKSKMLLPPDPVEEEEEVDPRDELTRRLLEYKKFKEIADTLQDKENERKDLFARHINEETKKQLVDDAKEVYFEANLFDLIEALTEALKKVPEEVIHEIIQEEFTVEQKIHSVLHLMLDRQKVQFGDLFKACRSRVEAIVTFLAILELIRLKEITAVQNQNFGSIEISRNKDNIAAPSSQAEPETPNEPSQEGAQEVSSDDSPSKNPDGTPDGV